MLWVAFCKAGAFGQIIRCPDRISELEIGSERPL